MARPRTIADQIALERMADDNLNRGIQRREQRNRRPAMADEVKVLNINTVRRRWIANLNEVERLHAERRKLAMRCPHDWKYHPDPSGNNDSYYTCDVCGRTSSRRPDHA